MVCKNVDRASRKTRTKLIKIMCLFPVIRQNKKYTSTKKNGGIVPAISDIRVLAVPIGCGKCIECRKKKAREWQVRLLEDVKTNKNGIFVTLTFSNESIKELLKDVTSRRKKKDESVTQKSIIEEGYETDNAIAKLGIRRFLERWRKKYKKSVRHWLVTELGHNGTENIHMHGIIWTDIEREEIEKIWGYGFVWMPKKKEGYVSERTVNYITKYINKADQKHKEYNPKVLTSSGIGRSYIESVNAKKNIYKKNETNETYTTRTGHKIAMPVYWRNKIYTEEEREKLWLEKLDKGERWVLGQKINIKEEEDTYYEVVKEARIKNKRLGYGDNVKDWNRKQYERERRQLMLQKRIE